MKINKNSKIQRYLKDIPSPSYVLEEGLLKKNLKLLKYIQDKSEAKILLALKGFAFYHSFNLVKKYLKGACVSGIYEAKLAKKKLGLEVHTYSPAYKKEDIEKIAKISNCISFNSFNSFHNFKNLAKKINPKISLGLRINPQYSSSPSPLYDPCSKHSRLGIKIQDFKNEDISLVDGLHFHTLCEENVDALINTLKRVEEKFSKYLKKMKWINFGGGHHITKNGYDVEKLIILIKKFKKKYDLDIYLEPGEAVGLNTGVLVSTVIDIVYNDMFIAILDTSAEAHMPDVLAMPYKPKIRNEGKKFKYRLAGNTCLSGDIIGDYFFDKKLNIGDKIIFEDMIHYTMVKNTMFNGIKLPSIVKISDKLEIIKKFKYKDYKRRL